MSWLFWILLLLPVLFAIQGFRQGMVKTVVSMVFFIVVIAAASWLNPYVSDYFRSHTNWQKEIQAKCKDVLFDKIEEQEILSVSWQAAFIEELPLPLSMKEKIEENNNGEIYQRLAVDNFADYLSGYIAYSIMNGIAFLLSYILAMILVKVLLYALNVVTELPVISLLNRLGGMLLGGFQGILWVWVIFLAVTLLYHTEVGGFLLAQIKADTILTWLYDHNYLMRIITRIIS